MLPLNETDFLDFVYNYFKAEYAPIRSIWATATAEPRQPQRWMRMGNELMPLSFRPANAQAQKDLDSLDYFIRKWNLDAAFLRGLIIRFSKYEVHERLEKKLFESCRLDLMVRKALKEKHLIDALWPSPAPKNIDKDLLSQGVQVRRWYGDMFTKYFRKLHSVEEFSLRPEVDAKIKSSQTLMLVPFVDHLVFGEVDPIRPIVAHGSGYSNTRSSRQIDRGTFGEPDQFEIRFDAPTEIEDTHTKSVVRQCQCLKCGSKRDVRVNIFIDPTPGTSLQRSETSTRAPSNPNTPGYAMPGAQEQAPPMPPRPQPQPQPQDEPHSIRSPSPQQKRQCPRCTFLNHPELTSCEMCQADLPDATIVSKPPSPVVTASRSFHSHSVSLPPPASANTQPKGQPSERPTLPNRHSLSSTLFSIFPFSQQHQSEHHANLPSTQSQSGGTSDAPEMRQVPKEPEPKRKAPTAQEEPSHKGKGPEPQQPPQKEPSLPKNQKNAVIADSPPDTPLNQTPELAMMPLTPPPASSSQQHAYPAGMPQSLMDDFVPVSPAFNRTEEEEDAGWGEMSKEEARNDEDSEDEGEIVGRREGMVDLDAVAREEMGVWGERDD
ncbi:hypothetical protein BS50DRAFT_549359 [Corynespora cassiicola Philippines]|uniref:RanBP2-type domain-containing protein n=1 Tax=Corynespora cassiicola Philippines TaxID=1448308 RepID=A0A2T2NU41_CORCC|nr:hypothetical protein BS50DRAFT_549359 [Corynespora cassiicola Philippines]